MNKYCFTIFIHVGVWLFLLSAEMVRASLPEPKPTAAPSHQDIFPGLTGNELVDSLRVHFRPASLTSSYNEARDVMFGDIYLDDTGTVTCVYTGDRLTHDPESGLSVRLYAQDNGWNTEHIWPQSMGAGSGNARIDLHHLRPIRADVNASRSNYPFAYLEPQEVTRWWRGDQSQTAVPSGDLREWSRTRSNSPSRFQVYDVSKGDVARAMFYFYTMYPVAARDADPQYLYVQMDVLRSYHNNDPVDADELSWTWDIAGYQDGKPNPFVVDTTLIRRAYFEDYEPWDPSDAALDGPDAFLVEYTFAGTAGCGEQNPMPVIPEIRVNASAMQRTGVVCNEGANMFNSRQWPTGAVRSPDHYIHFTITAGDRPIDLSGGSDVAYQIRRSGTGPDRYAWRVRIDDGDWQQLDAGTLTGTGDLTREVVLAMPEGSDEAVQTIEFRMYAWNASSGGGTLRLNYITVDGLLSDPAETFGVTVPGAYPGWRLMSFPSDGVRLADLVPQNQIQGIDGVGELYAGAHPGIEFEHETDPNVLWYGAGYDSGPEPAASERFATSFLNKAAQSGGEANSSAGQAIDNGWIVPEDIFSSITPGTGLAWYFFHNDRGPSRPLPFELSVTGVPFGADVDAPLSPGWNLMGNPFAGAIALEDIRYLDNAGTELHPVAVAQTWNAGEGSWDIVGPGETIAAWQGFFIEDKGADAVRFRVGIIAQSSTHYETAHWRRFKRTGVGHVAGEGTLFNLRFSLIGEDADDGHRTADHALSLIFHSLEGPGSDRFGMRKIPPLTDRYVQAFFLDPASRQPRAQESRHVDSDPFALPLDVRSSGISGTFTLGWSGVDALPAGRRITLVDNKTGAQIDLRENGSYEFEWVDGSGDAQYDTRFTLKVTSGTATQSEVESGLPDRMVLHQNYPNPFNPSTVITYELPEQVSVRLTVYDTLGRAVAVLVDEPQGPGRHEVTWDASTHSSGHYFYRIDAGGNAITRSTTLLR